MQIFKTPSFEGRTKALGITDEQLEKAVEEIDDGLHDGNLGGGLFKKRVARPNQGKSGSYRTFIAYREGKHAVYLYALAKNERDNITKKEKEALKQLAKSVLSLSDKKLQEQLEEAALIRVVSRRQDDE